MKRLEIPLGAGAGLLLMRSLARLRFRSLTAFACGMVRANRCEHSNVGGSARSLRSLAEWCTPPGEGEGKDGRRGELLRCRRPHLRRPSFLFFTLRAVHHSARRDSVERNLLRTPLLSLFYPACGAPFRETRQRRAEPPSNTTPFPFLPCVRCTIPRDATASSGTSN